MRLGAGSHERAGVFTFGGVDTDHCGPVMDYRPIKKATLPDGTTSYAWWLFDVESFSLGNETTTQSWLAEPSRYRSYLRHNLGIV